MDKKNDINNNLALDRNKIEKWQLRWQTFLINLAKLVFLNVIYMSGNS